MEHWEPWQAGPRLKKLFDYLSVYQKSTVTGIQNTKPSIKTDFMDVSVGH